MFSNHVLILTISTYFLSRSWQAHLNLIEKQSKNESLRVDGEMLQEEEADTTPLRVIATLAIKGPLPTR